MKKEERILELEAEVKRLNEALELIERNKEKNRIASLLDLEKVEEDWLLFETTRDIYPLVSIENDLDKESRLYNYMYQWKQKFDPEEVDCKNNEVRWYIYRYYDGEWYIFNWVKNYTYGYEENLEVYFTTEEKAEQCLEWLKKERVLY